MHARLGGTRQAGKRRQSGPSAAVREIADGVYNRPEGPDAARYTPVDAAI
jgi:hypothetical protein